MVKKWEKFINKNIYKDILNKIIEDIINNNLDWYYIKPLIWHKNYFRIRKWNIRIIFEKNEIENNIVAVDTRWQIYRWL